MDILIQRATEHDGQMIADLGRVAVKEAHQNSCSPEDMDAFLSSHYNEQAIRIELTDPANIYHLVSYKGSVAGFSKIVLDAAHPNILHKNVTKLDRIYLSNNFYHLGLGAHLLQHNIALSKQAQQRGMWLFTWIKNERAVNFYKRNGFVIIGDHMFKVSDTHYNPNYHMLLEY